MIRALFTHRTRGFRTINVVLTALMVTLAVGVNLAKTVAGKERSEIGRVERSVSQEKQRIRVLEAEVAHLEQPERLERLSRAYLDMAPVSAKQEASADRLYEIAGAARHAPAAPPPVQASVETTPGPVEPVEAEAAH